MNRRQYNRSGGGTSKHANAIGKHRKLAVIYTRVSSKEQEREGYSIPAQKKLLRDYAAKRDIEIVREFEDVESAKDTGRRNFNKMIKWLRSHPNQIVLAEKTDRLTRNMTDGAKVLEGLNIEMHFPKEHNITPRNACANEKFLFAINMANAKRYIDNLAEESRKGQDEKASQGIWPTLAPLGYLNVGNSDGRRVIAIDPVAAPLISDMYKWYATGNYSVKEITQMARSAGLAHKRTGGTVPRRSVHKILRNPLYAGWFEWRGKVYMGKHEPIVPEERWNRVQRLLDEKSRSKTRRVKHDFPYTNLIKCADCGSSIVAQNQKGKYTYYHCTGYRNRDRDEPLRPCRHKLVRQEELDRQFSDKLRQLHFGEEHIEWMRKELLADHSEALRANTEAIRRLQTLHARLEKRIDEMYIDKLEGRISQEQYDRKADEWREEQKRCQKDIGEYRQTGQSYMAEGLMLPELIRNAPVLFKSMPPTKKRQLLKLVFADCTWKDGEVTGTFNVPFAVIASLARKDDGSRNSDS